MHIRSSHIAILALCSAAMTGCDWGSAGDNTWNDSYAWANFTGTYRFTQAIVAPSDSGTSEDSSGTSSGYHESHPTALNGKLDSAGASATISLIANKGKNEAGEAIKRGSVSVRIADTVLTVNSSTGEISYSGHNIGSVDYVGGVITISGAAILGYPGGTSVTGSYIYFISDTVPPTEKTVLSYLNVTQRGNKLTITSDNGQVYTGQITGASMGADGYVAAQRVNLSFEVSHSSGAKIVGNFSGNWSGAQNSTYGTLDDRQIHGTLSNGTTFVGTAAPITIHVPDVTVSE